MAQELVTPRLLLRSQRLDDAEAIRLLWSERDPRSMRLIDPDGHPTVEQMRGRLADQLDESDRAGLSLLAIERQGEPGFIGYCGLIVGEASLSEPEIAFELNRDFHGQGFATEAALAVLDAARATGRTRVWATVREWNAPSVNLLTRLGFTDSGRRSPDADRGEALWMTVEL
jgi:RimJ/RimL family protein N-acetyltransferase